MVVKKRKTIEGWKKKEWYLICAPKLFEEKPVGSTPADLPQKLIGRIIAVPLREITGSLNHQFTKLMLKIVDVKGKNAYTALDSFELVKEYLYRNVRRRKSLVKTVKETSTKDNQRIQMTMYVFSARKIETSKKEAIRKQMDAVIEKTAKESTLDAFVQKALFGGLVTEVFRDIKRIAPTKRVEIAKCEIMKKEEKNLGLA